MGKLYGYARVSSRDQNEERQIIALKKEGINDEDIYVDKQSGKDFIRPEYQRLVKKLRKGDVLFVLSIDRLGRNYIDIQEQWRYITQKKKVDVVIIDMPLLDTRKDKNLMGTFIADIVLQLLSFVAENERNNIRARQAEGIAAAKARGVHFGNKELPITDAFWEAYDLYINRKVDASTAAKICGMSRATFYRKINTLGQAKIKSNNSI